jgi:hypothetical protein
MTTIALVPSTTDRLRLVLRADAVVTAAVGVLALESPLSWYGGAPGWLVRGLGVVLLVTGVDLALLSRASGRVLRIGTTVAAELAFAWVLATVAVLAVEDLPAAGAEVLVVVGLLTLGFGIAYHRLARALP